MHDLTVSTNAMSKILDKLDVTFNERSKSSERLFAVTCSMAVVCVVHLGLWLTWVGGTTEKLLTLKENDKAQSEMILKIEQSRAAQPTPQVITTKP